MGRGIPVLGAAHAAGRFRSRDRVPAAGRPALLDPSQGLVATGVEMAIKTISNRDEKGQFLDIMAVEGIAA